MAGCWENYAGREGEISRVMEKNPIGCKDETGRAMGRGNSASMGRTRGTGGGGGGGEEDGWAMENSVGCEGEFGRATEGNSTRREDETGRAMGRG